MNKSLFKRRKELEKQEEKWEVEKELLIRKEKLDSERKQYKKKKHSISTSKLLILFLFINCSIIEIFTGWATVKMLTISLVTGLSVDFTPLVTLIGAVVGEVFGYAIYSLKAAKENSKNGIVYDLAMHDKINETDDSVG